MYRQQGQRRFLQALIQCPHGYPGQQGRHEQMDVDITQPFAHKFVIVNEFYYLIIVRAGCHGKILQESEYLFSIFEVAAGQFTDNEGVTGDLAVI